MHEYMKRLLKALSNGVIDAGSVAVALVAHDDSCGIYSGGICDCDPEITIETDRGKIRVTREGLLKET